MPFLIQGKTNWKYILIVVILALIVGGGILFLLTSLVCSECKGRFIAWCENCQSFGWPNKIEESPPFEKLRPCLEYCLRRIFPKTVTCDYAKEICRELGIKTESPVEKKITLITNKTEYKTGEILKITVKNDSTKSIWYREWCKYKCNESLCECGDSFFIEKKENGEYKIYHPPDSIGVWYLSELVELKSGSEKLYQLELIKFSEGTYRLGMNFGFSKESFDEKRIYSNEFIIKEKIEDETANWKTYFNPEVNFTFRYPQDWEIKEEYQYKSAACQMNPECEECITFFLIK